MDSPTEEAVATAARTRVSIDMGCSCYPLMVAMDQELVNEWVRAAIDLMAFAIHSENSIAKRLIDEAQSRSRYFPKKNTEKVGNIIKVRVRISKPRFAYRFVVGLEERDFRTWVHTALNFMAYCFQGNVDSTARTPHRKNIPAPQTPAKAARGKTKARSGTNVSDASDIGVDKDDLLAMLSDPIRWGQ